MKATPDEIRRRAVAIPLAYLRTNYDDREGWLSLAELRRYGWEVELTTAEVYKTLKQMSAPVIHDRVRWVGEQGQQPTGKGIRLRKRLARRLWVFRFIPFVRMVGLMNSVAAGCASENSDIDIFVVAKSKRLWTVRLIALTVLTILGWRSRVADKTGRLSMDLFLSEDGLDLSNSGVPVDYLTAYWVADFTPVIYAEKFREFWAANRWMKDKLPIAYRSPRQWDDEVEMRPAVLTKFVEWLLRGRWGNRVERMSKARQMKKVQKNIERFVVVGGAPGLVLATDTIVKIHFDDSKRDRINQAIEHALAD
jgi:hypothetical protein